MNILLTYLSNRKKEGTRFLGTLACLCGLVSTQMATAQDFYVTPDGNVPVDYNGSSIDGAWSNTDEAKLVTLEEALQQARPGDEIWVQGFEEIRRNSGGYRQVYLAPEEGWTLKAGVKLYGGFKGNETSLEQRATLGKAYNFACRSILSGDINMNDTIDHVNLISSSNALRADNAVHVLTMDLDNSASDNKNETVSVLDGFTIVGGHALENGGGVLVKGHGTYSCAYRIERCFFFNNYAVQNGGAIYVDADAGKITADESYINQCVVYNNEAGLIADVSNKGGGIYIAGKGTVVNTSVFNNENGGVRISPDANVLNSTIARNTVAGVDLTDNGGKNENAKVVNTVVWGNTKLYSEFTPGFMNSSYHEVEGEGSNRVDAFGNVYVSDKNNDRSQASPFFASPSLRTCFDRDFNWLYNAYPLWSWQALEGSAFVDGGKDDAYASATYGAYDLGGSARKVGNATDIGAYEFQAVSADRILRVSPDGDDANDGSSWDRAYKHVQAAIDKLAEGGKGGEVWVKAGTYQPSAFMSGSTTDRTAAFIMKDGVSVYGGFEGNEDKRAERDEKKKGSLPWQYTFETIFMGSAYQGEGGKCEYNATDNKWVVTGSNSNHVVWFAQEDGTAFKTVTVLDGVTVKGGSAQETVGTPGNFFGDRGAGVYMAGNAYLANCVVTENATTGKGGGVYLYGGRIIGSLLYNNEGYEGGAVYVDNSGIVLRSMLTNNSGYDGAGVYMVSDTEWTDGSIHPEYQILSTSVVSNNTSRHNGAVYCDRGGVMLQTTLVNNMSVGTVDAADYESAQTGGLYVKGYGLAVNSVIWNNTIKGKNVPMYAMAPTVDKVRFFNTAVSGMNNAVWNNTLQEDMVSMGEGNEASEGLVTPEFTSEGMPSETGVDGSLTNVSYYWYPVEGSNLRSIGLELGRFPAEVVLAPELDIKGDLFAQKPSVGAVMTEKRNLVPQQDGNTLRLYVDVNCTDAGHDGSSWEKAYRSLNEAIEYFANAGQPDGIGKFEILVSEGNCYPRYSFVNLDPKTATINVLGTSLPLTIKGGFRVEGSTVERKPLEYRSVIDGNPDGRALEDGLYHCITVAEGADVEIDGFHVVGGYAAGTALYKSGAGMLVGNNAKVTVRNTIFENNSAVKAAAIDATADGCSLVLENCVVNNNTNVDESSVVVDAGSLTMRHVTVVNNKGQAPAETGDLYATSFSAGNTEGNTVTIATWGADGAKNFANPTNTQGATMGYDTYLGGYSEFRPQTGSSVVGEALINKVTNPVLGVSVDIVGHSRDLGGTPDLGAYEANLPESGSVLYVTAHGAGSKDGSSWENAIAGNNIYNVNQEPALADMGIVTTDSRYIGYYDRSDRPYAEISNASRTFSSAGNRVGSITNDRTETYVSGLQYAVERASKSNSSAKDYKVQVWVAGGTYTDYKGFVIRDYVEVLGGFPNEGAPGLEDRYPLIADGIPLREEVKDLKVDKYETILQIQSGSPVSWSYDDATRLSTASVNTSVLASSMAVTRKPVLFQPDVCMTTTGPSENTARTNYLEYVGATWDGFTIRHGFQYGYYATRDGGGGVRMYRGVTLENCVVRDNVNATRRNRGGGIYCDGENSKVINCFVINNAALLHNVGEGTNWDCVGGGMYMILGTSYNTLLANNYATGDGGGVFLENAVFYNNTIAYNNSSNGAGGMYQFTANLAAGLTVYNTLFYGNKGRALAAYSASYFDGAYNCFISTDEEIDTNLKNRLHDGFYGVRLQNPFELGDDAAKECNYRLTKETSCLNHGTNELPNDITLPETDVDFTDRIKDCTVDIGAYERNNEDAVTPDGEGVYYVTFSGSGTATGDSPQNAACAMKLQEVLNAAGQRAATGAEATVKIAGYESATTKGMIYHPLTLSDPTDPLSYTFVIPEGVTVMGGYYEGTYTNGRYDEGSGTWDKADRNAAQYMTVLSAICQATANRQEVNGYHVVQFGKDGMSALGKPAVLDGVYLEDGLATASTGSGSSKTRGGGAIVPAGAHVRNCVVRNNEAVEGGGLFVLPGGMVSGCGVMQNKADKGAGIYLSAEGGVTESNRAHVVSTTIVENEAAETGGGIYLEDGAALAVNTVVWGNTSPSDKNISGVTDGKYKDDLFGSVSSDENDKGGFYPFNNCFVETYELPGNFQNQPMETDRERYFSAYYLLRPFSVLVKGGTTSVLQKALEEKSGVARSDMQGILRVQTSSDGQDLKGIDAGAYAYEGGSMRMPQNAEEVIRKIFVSQAVNVSLETGEEEDALKGRSFYTALSSLDEALDYIKKVRGITSPFNGSRMDFEIWMAEGTYKPRNARPDASTEGDEPNQRQNSFVIPKGVKVFGGFAGTELYSYGVERLSGLSEKTLDDLSETDKDEEYVQGLLDKRESGDLNSNVITEPWEMAHQTILSGYVNLSAAEKNVYHVVYSKAGTGEEDLGGVVLDGLTVMDGETYHVMRGRDELGRGGGIYTVGVDYTLVRCRLLNNKAVRGGAVYALDADVTSVGTFFAGNGTVDGATVDPSGGETGEGTNVRGGAVYLAGRSVKKALKAVNTLWANNGTDIGTADNPSWGGAIALNGNAVADLMNNTFVRNKAGEYAAVYVPSTDGNKMVNTVVWGNEGTGSPVNIKVDGISYSACDVDFGGGEENVLLDTENNAINGPRFDDPSVGAGTDGNRVSAKWEPISISVLVDAGDGVEQVSDKAVQGAYSDWMKVNAPSYAGLYMGETPRYAGALDETGKPVDKRIDIGVFEYQYPTSLSALDIVYVATAESGKRDGTSWDNATSDLRGALNAMANSTAHQNTPDKEVRVKSGTYTMGKNVDAAGAAYQIVMSGVSRDVESLAVNGSYNESGIQDFSQPTVLKGAGEGSESEILLNVATNGKPVNISGLSFQDTGKGIAAITSGNGSLTVGNSAFRQTGTGLSISDNATGGALIANTLFADGGTGMLVSSGDDVKVVNATFANNSVAGVDGSAEVYNSVAWNSGEAGFIADEGNGNEDLGSEENTDLDKGPNFVDPSNADKLQRDYNIRPGFTLLNKGNDVMYEKYVSSDITTEKDLAGKSRKVGARIDIGAYEYASELNKYIYVKQGVAGSDNTGSSWDNAMGDLQSAVDLATVYADTPSEEYGYVFVHQNVENDGQLRLTRGGVKVYGGMNAETVTDDVTVENVLEARNGLLETAERSVLGAVSVSGRSVVDGFEVSDASSVADGGMLSTSILKAGAEIGANGILYNTLVEGADVTGTGRAVNVTSTGTISVASKYKIVENAAGNSYVNDGFWKYQLDETSGDIDDASEATETEACMTLAGHGKDIAGNKRVRNNVDNGCFETWNVTGITEVSSGDYPHGKSVVYVREGNEIRLMRDYSASSPFNPGFLLLEHGAGLWGNGKQVALTNFAVERKLTGDNGYKDLVAMPFSLTDMTVDGTEYTEAGENGVAVYRYDGRERAAYGYKFQSGNSPAWKTMDNVKTVTEGLLFDASGANTEKTVRFYGSSYTEDGNPKDVVLYKYNFNSPWSPDNNTGEKFTHKENMSWNLFGSPYLCTMNYEDMEYGRVVYGYANNGYYTDGMGLSDDGTRTKGNIPVGSAVFTQSATLKETETFTVGMRKAEIDNNTRSTKLALYVASAAGKRGLGENGGIYDELQLTAVPSEEASTEFDLARDGVKWMNDNGEPEIFAVRDGGRYSLLSAIDREGTIGVGLSLPETGMYSIGIPEDCEAEDYEYVILKDAATGKAADLKEGAYSFRTAEAGVAEGRFTLSFKRMDADQRHAIYVKSGMGKATVFGVNDGDVVTVVTVDGKVVAVEEAVGSEVTFALAKGAYLFKVAGADGRTTVVKAMVR